MRISFALAALLWNTLLPAQQPSAEKPHSLPFLAAEDAFPLSPVPRPLFHERLRVELYLETLQKRATILREYDRSAPLVTAFREELIQLVKDDAVPVSLKKDLLDLLTTLAPLTKKQWDGLFSWTLHNRLLDGTLGTAVAGALSTKAPDAFEIDRMDKAIAANPERALWFLREMRGDTSALTPTLLRHAISSKEFAYDAQAVLARSKDKEADEFFHGRLDLKRALDPKTVQAFGHREEMKDSDIQVLRLLLESPRAISSKIPPFRVALKAGKNAASTKVVTDFVKSLLKGSDDDLVELTQRILPEVLEAGPPFCDPVLGAIIQALPKLSERAARVVLNHLNSFLLPKARISPETQAHATEYFKSILKEETTDQNRKAKFVAALGLNQLGEPTVTTHDQAMADYLKQVKDPHWALAQMDQAQIFLLPFPATWKVLFLGTMQVDASKYRYVFNQEGLPPVGDSLIPLVSQNELKPYFGQYMDYLSVLGTSVLERHCADIPNLLLPLLESSKRSSGASRKAVLALLKTIGVNAATYMEKISENIHPDDPEDVLELQAFFRNVSISRKQVTRKRDGHIAEIRRLRGKDSVSDPVNLDVYERFCKDPRETVYQVLGEMQSGSAVDFWEARLKEQRDIVGPLIAEEVVGRKSLFRSTDRRFPPPAKRLVEKWGEYFSTEMLEDLEALLLSDDPQVGDDAAESLMPLAAKFPPSTIREFVDRLVDDKRSNLALEVLGHARGRIPVSAAERLMQMSEADPLAERALGNLEKFPEEVLAHFKKNLAGEHAQATFSAMEQMGNRAPDSVIELLSDLVAADRTLAYTSLFAIAVENPKRVVPLILSHKAFTDPSSTNEERGNLLTVLKRLGERSPASLTFLIPYLDSPQPLVRARIREVIGGNGSKIPPEGVPALVAKFHEAERRESGSSEKHDTHFLAIILANLNAKALELAVPTLGSMLSSSDSYLRNIGVHGGARALEKLPLPERARLVQVVEYAEDEELALSTWRKVEGALPKYPGFERMLEKKLRSPRVEDVVDAAILIRPFRDQTSPAAGELLLQHLHHKNHSVQTEALKTLIAWEGKQPDGFAAAALQLIKDDRPLKTRDWKDDKPDILAKLALAFFSQQGKNVPPEYISELVHWIEDGPNEWAKLALDSVRKTSHERELMEQLLEAEAKGVLHERSDYLESIWDGLLKARLPRYFEMKDAFLGDKIGPKERRLLLEILKTQEQQQAISVQ